MSDKRNSPLLVLQGLNNGLRGQIYKVQRPIIVGRSKTCDLFIADARSSRQQARFFRGTNGGLMVEDLQSSNGTFVNGRQIVRHKLSEGDVIRLGNTDFRAMKFKPRPTVEVVDSIFPQEAKVIKKASSVVFPRINTMHTEDYFRALGISREDDRSRNNQVFEALQRKTRNFAVLFDISTLVQKYTDPDEMLSAVVEVLLKVPGGDVAYIMLLDEQGELKVRVSRSNRTQSSMHFLISKTVCSYVLEKQCAVVAPDLRNDERFSGSTSIMMGATGSIMAVPIIIESKACGLIAISTETVQAPPEEDLDLICVAAGIIGPALLNIELRKKQEQLNIEIEETQREVVFTMGSIGETRSKETGNHVKRVAEYSKLLALLSGLSEKEAELLKQASPMHDIGKVGIPDNILHKPGKLNAEEWTVMKTHARLGYDMLKHSKRPILNAASIVAHEHHEKWAGNGYPRGLKGEEIHVFGRITALADVFDALGSDRCYKKAWPLERILKLFREERGRHFDPKLVDLFMENLDQFLQIRDQYKD